MGIQTMIRNIPDIAFVAPVGPWISLSIALAITTPEAAPTPCKNLKTDSSKMPGAMKHPLEARQ